MICARRWQTEHDVQCGHYEHPGRCGVAGDLGFEDPVADAGGHYDVRESEHRTRYAQALAGNAQVVADRRQHVEQPEPSKTARVRWRWWS